VKAVKTTAAPVNDSNVIDFPDPKLHAMLQEMEACAEAIKVAKHVSITPFLYRRRAALIEKVIKCTIPSGPKRDEITCGAAWRAHQGWRSMKMRTDLPWRSVHDRQGGKPL
jgi:hypothetical protein